MTDSIADLLTRIRNGYLAHNSEVTVPFSTQKATIANVLLTSGYLESVQVEDDAKKYKVIIIKLKYIGREPAISSIQRVSTPGRRVYSKTKDVKRVLSGNGIRIVTTSQGVMIDSEARAKNLGGEIICKVW
jgi:small subunit ribosomal protein S8